MPRGVLGVDRARAAPTAAGARRCGKKRLDYDDLHSPWFPRQYDGCHSALAHHRRRPPMPMIDVYATTGTFSDKHALAKDLANAVMRWEKVPPIALFKNNTAAFVHELPGDSLSNAAGDSNYVRVQVLTPVGVLDREKQIGG